ncbi:hypothetical protein DFJ73DRAFT_867366 [Zopfochytrium polystomum]|nr:hypothetical protein DFJ73DRAFT_867366 [Zopfochytrium polystomum]
MPPPSRSHGAMPPPLALRLAPQLPPPRRPGGGGGSPPLLLPPPRFAPYHVPETLSSSSPASHYLPPPLNRQRTSSQGPPLFQSPYLEPPIGTDLHGGGGIGRARGLHAGTTSHPCYPVAAALPLEVPPPAEQLFLVRHHHDSYRHSHMLGHPQGQPGSNSTEQHTSQWEPREHRHHHLRDLDGYMVRVSSSPSLASFSPKAHLDADHDERNTVLGRSSNAWSHRAPSFQRSQERQHYYQRSESPAIGGTVCNHWGHRGAGWGSESWIKEEEDLWPEAEAPTAPLQEELLLRSPEVDRSLDGDSVGQSGRYL